MYCFLKLAESGCEIILTLYSTYFVPNIVATVLLDSAF